jgi:hypothetical protein
MKVRIILPVFAVGLISLCFASLPDMTGSWSGYLKKPDGDSTNLVYHFVEKGEKLFGSSDGPNGSLEISDGKIKDSLFSFHLHGNRDLYNTGKFYGDSIDLAVDPTGINLHIKLKRIPESGIK